MTAVPRLLRLTLRGALRGPLLPLLTGAMVLAAELLIRLSADGTTAVLSLMDLTLLLAPLLALVLGTLRVHDGRELTELLLAQPVGRDSVFLAVWSGLLVPLSMALTVGLVLPFAWHGLLTTPAGGLLLQLAGITLAELAIGTALACVIAIRCDDRVRALGVAIAAWLVFAIGWDAVILTLALVFADRAIEGPMIAMLLLNPLDLARVFLVLGSDAAAMLGHAGAILSRRLGADGGRRLLLLGLALWAIAPLALARRTFRRKDF